MASANIETTPNRRDRLKPLIRDCNMPNLDLEGERGMERERVGEEAETEEGQLLYVFLGRYFLIQLS